MIAEPPPETRPCLVSYDDNPSSNASSMVSVNRACYIVIPLDLMGWIRPG